MREVKFRAWDETNKVMVYNVNINNGKPVKPGYQWFNAENTILHSEPQQYTGVKDRNGKEIYEGDILHERHFVSWSREKGERYVDVFAVVWHDGGFTLKPIGKEHIRTLDWTQYEIVGNIYENPELIA